MRARLALLVTGLSLAVVAVRWTAERSTSESLAAQLATLRARNDERVALLSERNRLRAQAPTSAELASLRASLSERDRLLREIAARTPVPSPPTLAVGEMKPWRSWQNHGQSTPGAALETALWAAAGGDVRTFASLLEIDPSTRAKISALLTRLPSVAASAYSGPEALIAAVAMKNIPLADAQLAWLHESDTDHAFLGLLLNDPEHTSTPPAVIVPGPADVPPPALPDSRNSKLTFLALHRSDGAWHLLVPASAIDRVARELGLPGGG